ncbi:MAG TPA: 50S ribosomal protein L31 [Aquificae bacterium]|nr:50S ribosomal protein L31 [Aquificota bacterium]
MRLEVCNKCHPFYKGELTRARVSTKGRLEKFLAKYGDKYAQGKK